MSQPLEAPVPAPRTAPAGDGQSTPAGAIHDIGYRRYEGRRLGRGYVVRSLYLSSLRGAYGFGRTAKSKVMPFVLLGVMLVPALIIVAVTVFAGLDELPLAYPQYAVRAVAVIVIFVAAASPAQFSRDLRFSTIGLYLSRPLEVLDYVFAKFAALTTALIILLGLPLVVLYVGALLAELPFGEQTESFAQGLAAAVVFAVVLAAVGGLIASVTTRRGLGVAAVIGVLMVSYTAVNIVAGTAQGVGNDTLAEYAGLFSPITLVDSVQVWALGAESTSSAVLSPTGAQTGLVYVGVLAALTVVCLGLLLLRYRKVSR